MAEKTNVKTLGKKPGKKAEVIVPDDLKVSTQILKSLRRVHRRHV